MPNIVSVGSSGYTDIDSLLNGYKWDTLSLTFSFPTYGTIYPLTYAEAFNNFEPLNASQMATVRTIYRQISSFTNLTFTEVAPAAGDLQFAMTDQTSIAFGYYPYPDQKGGDSWYNNSSGLFDSPQVGNYAYLTFLHEVGHTLGLKHSFEFPAMSSANDSLEFTVMTYRSYVGASLDGYDNETYGYPQTYMMIDIYALQHMYGADYTTNGGNTVHRWNPSTGAYSINGVVQWTPPANRVFMTVWDGNGKDTYDLSNYTTNTVIDLRPGAWSFTSQVQLANLGDGQFARGNIANAFLFQDDPRSLIENAIGGSGNDRIIGNQAANRLEGRGGSDVLEGMEGADTLIGGTGADTMRGGAGNDIYQVDFWSADATRPRDKVEEAPGPGTGLDTVRSSVTYALPVNVEILSLTGTAATAGTGNGGANTITGNNAGNVLKGLGGNDTLRGDAALTAGGADTLHGGGGNDFLYGGLGNDTLRGDDAGARGLDRFYFDTTPNAASNRDAIADFNIADDAIYLKKTVFAGIAATGTLPMAAFAKIDNYNPASPPGRTPATADDRIIYDQANGKIYYDADGAGGAVAAVLFATVTPGLALTNADFIAY